MSNNATPMKVSELSVDQVADVITAMEIESSLNIGLAMIHTGVHPILGTLTVVATCGNQHALIRPGK